MPSNLFGPGSGPNTHRSASEVKADQDRARAVDQGRTRAAAAAGRDSRSIGTTRSQR
jgi:hypothetical protein